MFVSRAIKAISKSKHGGLVKERNSHASEAAIKCVQQFRLSLNDVEIWNDLHN